MFNLYNYEHICMVYSYTHMKIVAGYIATCITLLQADTIVKLFSKQHELW